MISQHRSTFVSTLSALALLGWVAFDLPRDAHADAAQSADYVDDAMERLQQSDPQAAIIQLKNALREDPENVEARRGAFSVRSIWISSGFRRRQRS